MGRKKVILFRKEEFSDRRTVAVARIFGTQKNEPLSEPSNAQATAAKPEPEARKGRDARLGRREASRREKKAGGGAQRGSGALESLTKEQLTARFAEPQNPYKSVHKRQKQARDESLKFSKKRERHERAEQRKEWREKAEKEHSVLDEHASLARRLAGKPFEPPARRGTSINRSRKNGKKPEEMPDSSPKKVSRLDKKKLPSKGTRGFEFGLRKRPFFGGNFPAYDAATTAKRSYAAYQNATKVAEHSYTAYEEKRGTVNTRFSKEISLKNSLEKERRSRENSQRRDLERGGSRLHRSADFQSGYAKYENVQKTREQNSLQANLNGVARPHALPLGPQKSSKKKNAEKEEEEVVLESRDVAIVASADAVLTARERRRAFEAGGGEKAVKSAKEDGVFVKNELEDSSQQNKLLPKEKSFAGKERGAPRSRLSRVNLGDPSWADGPNLIENTDDRGAWLSDVTDHTQDPKVIARSQARKEKEKVDWQKQKDEAIAKQAAKKAKLKSEEAKAVSAHEAWMASPDNLNFWIRRKHPKKPWHWQYFNLANMKAIKHEPAFKVRLSSGGRFRWTPPGGPLRTGSHASRGGGHLHAGTGEAPPRVRIAKPGGGGDSIVQRPSSDKNDEEDYANVLAQAEADYVKNQEELEKEEASATESEGGAFRGKKKVARLESETDYSATGAGSYHHTHDEGDKDGDYTAHYHYHCTPRDPACDPVVSEDGNEPDKAVSEGTQRGSTQSSVAEGKPKPALGGGVVDAKTPLSREKSSICNSSSSSSSLRKKQEEVGKKKKLRKEAPKDHEGDDTKIIRRPRDEKSEEEGNAAEDGPNLRGGGARWRKMAKKNVHPDVDWVESDYSAASTIGENDPNVNWEPPNKVEKKPKPPFKKDKKLPFYEHDDMLEPEAGIGRRHFYGDFQPLEQQGVENMENLQLSSDLRKFETEIPVFRRRRRR